MKVCASRCVIQFTQTFNSNWTTGSHNQFLLWDGESPLTFSISLSLERLDPLPAAAGTDEVRSSEPLPEPISDPWPRRDFEVVLGRGFCDWE